MAQGASDHIPLASLKCHKIVVTGDAITGYTVGQFQNLKMAKFGVANGDILNSFIDHKNKTFAFQICYPSLPIISI